MCKSYSKVILYRPAILSEMKTRKTGIYWINVHWRIQRVLGTHPPTPGPISFISIQFQQIFCQIIGWHPSFGISAPPPSLYGKSWILHRCGTKNRWLSSNNVLMPHLSRDSVYFFHVSHASISVLWTKAPDSEVSHDAFVTSQFRPFACNNVIY